MRVKVGAGWAVLLSELGCGREEEENGKMSGVHREGSGSEDVCRVAHRHAW